MPAGCPSPRPIYTVGHSTRSIEEFVALLRVGGVDCVVDVRTVPRSRTNPQYNADILPASLAERQIGYALIPELGGLRGRQKQVPQEVNGFWRNRSFRNYADYAMSASFQRGLEQLMATSADRTCAIMCSEAVWWRCHRRIIADYLLLAGCRVLHLMGKDRVDEATITPGAVIAAGVLTYPQAPHSEVMTDETLGGAHADRPSS